MEFIDFPEVTHRIAEGQGEYQTLPAQVGIMTLDKGEGELFGAIAVSCCAKLTPEELEHVNKTGTLFLTVLTFGNPLQPIHGTFLKPNMMPIPKSISG